MTALLTLFSGAWPAIIGIAVAAVGVLFGLFKHQTAKVATAQADTAKADAATAKANEAAANQQLASVVADQQAVAEAQKKLDDAAADRATIEAAVAALPVGGSQKELLNEFHR